MLLPVGWGRIRQRWAEPCSQATAVAAPSAAYGGRKVPEASPASWGGELGTAGGAPSFPRHLPSYPACCSSGCQSCRMPVPLINNVVKLHAGPSQGSAAGTAGAGTNLEGGGRSLRNSPSPSGCRGLGLEFRTLDPCSQLFSLGPEGLGQAPSGPIQEEAGKQTLRGACTPVTGAQVAFRPCKVGTSGA